MRSIRVAELTHPGEPPRFWVAVSVAILVIGFALVIVVGVAGPQALVAFVGVVLATWAGAWLSLQLLRARLVGRYAQVTYRSLPALAGVIDEQRTRLSFTRRVEFYVADEVEGTIRYSSYFGTKIVIIKGDLVAELDDPDRRAQAVFLIGSVLGHLSAKHLRFVPITQVVELLGKAKIFNVAISPYLRCAWYTGDNVGLYACGDAEAGLRALHRQFVGKDLAGSIDTAGLLEQADRVRRQLLPRLIMWSSAQPHLTERYLNALCFVLAQYPAQAQAWYDQLDPAAAAVADFQFARSPYGRAGGRPETSLWPVLAVASAAAVAVAAVLTSSAAQSTADGSARGLVRQSSSTPPLTVPPTGSTPPPPSSAPPSTPTTSPAAPTTQSVASTQEDTTAAVATVENRTGWVTADGCAAHAFGAVRVFLRDRGCAELQRSLMTMSVGGREVVVSVDRPTLTSIGDSGAFVHLITGNGSGDIRTLVDDGTSYAGGPASFAANPTFSARVATDGTSVDVLEAMWREGPTKDHDPDLQAVLDRLAARID